MIDPCLNTVVWETEQKFYVSAWYGALSSKRWVSSNLAAIVVKTNF